jgi:hypothetical protein
MRTESGVAFRRTSAIQRTAVPEREHPFPAFVITVRAMWPDKTAAHLAAACGVSERCAKFWLSGDRAPSTTAFMAIMDRITGRVPIVN